MPRRFIRRLLPGILLLTPALAGAQEPLSLDRAVQAALAGNASLRAARAAVDEAAAHAAEARSLLFPRISLNESWQRGNDPVFAFGSLLSSRQFAASDFAIPALNHPAPISLFRASAAIEQVLFDGGRGRAAARAAARRREIASLSSDERAASIAVAATRTFGQVLLAEAAGRAAAAGLDASREDLARAERRRDAGMATDADVLALGVHVADLERRVIQAQADAAVSRAELNRLMGDPVDAIIHVAEPPAAALDDPAEEVPLSGLLAEADAARPEIKRAAAAQQAAEASRRHAAAALLPEISAQAGLGFAGTRLTDRAASWVVGGGLRWTSSAGGAEIARVRGAGAALVRSRAEADEARAAVHVEVVTALRRLESARARESVGRAAVAQARESQRIVRDRFDAGLASVTDVLRAASALLEADASRISALVGAMEARAMLRQALGRAP